MLPWLSASEISPNVPSSNPINQAMSLRNDRQSGSSNVVRLFVWTAVIAVVFSIGLILGQRLLIEHQLPPAVSTQPDPGDQATAGESDPEDDEASTVDLFSFYDALAGGDLNDIAVDAAEASDRFPAVDDPGAESDTEADDEQTDEAPARYTLQIASLPSMEQARTEMDRLESMELEPNLISTRGPGDETLYQVQIGKFPNEEDARAYRNRLQNNHDLRALVTPL